MLKAASLGFPIRVSREPVRQAVLVDDELGNLLHVVEPLEYLEELAFGIARLGKSRHLCSGEIALLPLGCGLSGLHYEAGGNPLVVRHQEEESLALLQETRDVPRFPLGYFDDLPFPLASPAVLDPHDDLVSVEGPFYESRGHEDVLLSPLVRNDKTVAAPRAPEGAHFEVHLVGYSEPVVLQPDEGAVPRQLPEKVLDLPLPAFPGVDHAFEVVERKGTFLPLEHVEEVALREIDREALLHWSFLERYALKIFPLLPSYIILLPPKSPLCSREHDRGRIPLPFRRTTGKCCSFTPFLSYIKEFLWMSPYCCSVKTAT